MECTVYTKIRQYTYKYLMKHELFHIYNIRNIYYEHIRYLINHYMHITDTRTSKSSLLHFRKYSAPL